MKQLTVFSYGSGLTEPSINPIVAPMRKQLSIFILFLLLFSLTVTALHHHDDAADHQDCPICVAGHNQPNSCPHQFKLEFAPSVSPAGYHTPPSAVALAAPFTPANNRAPPA